MSHTATAQTFFEDNKHSEGEDTVEINLLGKVALVTGGTGELGRVMARTLGSCGADVIVHYRSNRDKAEELTAELREMGVKAMAVHADITDQNSILKMKQAVEEGIGLPNIVVANAVIQIHPWSSVLTEDPADYESQFQSCVMQTVYLAKAFLPEMIRCGYGRYIAINTECAMEAAAESSAYVAGKRGLDGVIRTLAREVGGHQITVNQVAPGWTISEQHAGLPEDHDAAYRKTVPLGRRGTAQEIANVVAFMASDLASFITGAYIPVAGGRVMPAI